MLINLDIPWNPARLEQRIGRIARLGQKSASVTILNLWYPDSIEAKMYRRLLERRDLYELAVGEFPEIFSKAIRDAVTSDEFDVDDALFKVSGEVQKLRLDAQHVALNATWNVDVEVTPASQVMFEELEAALDRAQTIFGLSAAPSGKIVNLTDDRLDQMAMIDLPSPQNSRSIYSISSGPAVMGFAIDLEGGKKLLLPSEAFPAVLLAAANIEPIDVSEFKDAIVFSDDDDLTPLLQMQRWLPDYKLISGNVSLNSDSEFSFENLAPHPGMQTELIRLGAISTKGQ